jgi:hypothetical protein
MNLKSIIAISGKPGLFKVIAQGKNSVIVESLTDNKRFPAYASDRISALEDISIYTYEEDKPLTEIYELIFIKEDGGKSISHKESAANLQEYLLELLPNYDQERVYSSDIKKLFQWYNQLHTSGELKMNESEVKEETEPVKGEEPVVEKEAKKVVPKAKTAVKKTPAKLKETKPKAEKVEKKESTTPKAKKATVSKTTK